MIFGALPKYKKGRVPVLQKKQNEAHLLLRPRITLLAPQRRGSVNDSSKLNVTGSNWGRVLGGREIEGKDERIF